MRPSERAYRLRVDHARDLSDAMKALPEGYRTGTTLRRLHATHSWRDPSGRFHVMTTDRKGRKAVLSVWLDEIRAMLGIRLLDIGEYDVDPLLTVADLTRLSMLGIIPDSWLKRKLAA